MQVDYKNPAELKPYEQNAKIHTAEQIERIKSSIKSFGFRIPVLIDEANEILAGHGRTRAAIQLGLDRIPVVQIKGLTEEQKRAFRLADNKTASLAEWDENALAPELEGIFDIDMGQFGFEIDPIDPESFGLEIDLPEPEKPDKNTMTFKLSAEQYRFIKECEKQALQEARSRDKQANDRGNAVAEIAQQYLDMIRRQT